MELKILAEQLLERFKQDWNRYEKHGSKKIDNIVFFSGVKANDYWLPKMYLGSKSDPAIMDVLEGDEAAWYVEVFINDLCVFRDCRTRARREIPKPPDENLQFYENFLLEQLMYACFTIGIRKMYEGAIEISKRY